MKLQPSNAQVYVYTFREGALSPVGHDLKLAVTDFEIEVDPDTLEATGRFGADSLRVAASMVDGGRREEEVSARDRKKIESNIAKDVLKARAHPQIQFETTSSRRDGDGFTVVGQLELRGERREIEASFEPDGDGYRARFGLDQTRFGIKPYTAFFGALKVQPVVEIELVVPRLM